MNSATKVKVIFVQNAMGKKKLFFALCATNVFWVNLCDSWTKVLLLASVYRSEPDPSIQNPYFSDKLDLCYTVHPLGVLEK